MPFAPIEIVGVITDEVGSPRNDGGRGSALYAVPIRLSRSLSSEVLSDRSDQDGGVIPGEHVAA